MTELNPMAIANMLNELNPQQQEAANTIYGPVLVLAGAGSGKALKNGSKVQTPNGPVSIENLKVNDIVFDSQGGITKVIGVFPQGKKEIWEVEFSDGTVIECCKDHLWNYQTARQRTAGKPYKTATLEEIHKLPLKTKGGDYERWNLYIPMTKPVAYTEKKLAINPYLLGALIGDGGLTSRSYTFSNSEDDIATRINSELQKIGYELRYSESNNYYIGMLKQNRVSHLRLELERLGLSGLYSHEKYIPSSYLQSSVEQRLELLKGLIDTDGECDASNYYYSTTSKQLALDIVRLVQSLGMTATVEERKTFYTYHHIKKEGKPSYRLTIKTSDEIPKIHSSLKHEMKWRKGQSSARRTIRRITPTGVMSEMTCIKVDAEDELFLTDGYVVTHNTKTLTTRIANMMSQGISSGSIFCATFTNKAAREMKERLESVVGEDPMKHIWMGTFHSLCVRILRKHGHLLGYEQDETSKRCKFVIYDTGDVLDVIERIYKQMNIEDRYKPGFALNYIDTAKNNLWDPEYCSYNVAEKTEDQVMAQVYMRYQFQMQQMNAMDFGDLIMNTVLVLRDFPEARDYWQNKFQHVLADEFQDANYAQLQLLLLLSAPHYNLFVVGDDSQSIYGFRGSDISIILNFENMFPNASVIKLEQNYRSVRNVVEAGNTIIRHNQYQKEKTLVTAKEDGEPIQVIGCGTEYQEAAYIAATIKKKVIQEGYTYNDVAILYRGNAQSRIIEDFFRNQFIPYTIVGGSGFYDREEIKDTIAYLRAIFNRKDDTAILRIINKPSRGIGKTSQEKIEQYANDNKVSIYRALKNVSDIPTIQKRAATKVTDFFDLLDHFQKKLESGLMLTTYVRYVMEQSGLWLHYENDKKSEEKIDNLKEFLILVEKYETDYPDKTLEDFLQEISLVTDTEDKNKSDSVRMMTMHASKG